MIYFPPDERVHTFDTTSGGFTSVDYPTYSPNTESLYVITNPTNEPMKLTFTDFELAGDGDFVEVTKQLTKRTFSVTHPLIYLKKE